MCNEQNRFLLTNQMNSMSAFPEKILLEPVSKNTAPALTLAALFILDKFGDTVLFSMPSDHSIQEDIGFFQAVELAYKLAKQGGIVTFGIDIKKPDVNFGYIKKGETHENKYFQLSEFYEKPNSRTAQDMFESQEFLWNSGMFIMKASSWIDKLKSHAPDILTACEKSIQKASEVPKTCQPASTMADRCPTHIRGPRAEHF